MIERLYLNRGWTFKKEKDTLIVDVPHNVFDLKYNYLNEDDYQMISSYEKEIEIPNDYIDKHLFLTFDGVAHKSEVYINDKLVITHYCGYDRFVVDIKDYVNYGNKNTIKVIVDSNEKLNIPPFGNVIDYLTYGGIYRDVYLDICNNNYVKDLFIKPVYENNKWSCPDTTTNSNINPQWSVGLSANLGPISISQFLINLAAVLLQRK